MVPLLESAAKLPLPTWTDTHQPEVGALPWRWQFRGGVSPTLSNHMLPFALSAAKQLFRTETVSHPVPGGEGSCSEGLTPFRQQYIVVSV